MLNNNKRAALTVLSLSLLSFFAVYAQPLIAQLAMSQQQTSSNTSWLTEKWTGNEKPYATARENIDNDFSHGRITVAYLSNLEEAWNQNEHDPLTLFRWSYARYVSQNLNPALPFTTVPSYGAFDEVTSPHTYQYTRVRFLTEVMIGSHPELMAAGQRLLDRNPNDFDVEYGLTACFPQYMSANDKDTALAYATHLINKYPNKPSVYSVKGGIYFGYWIDHRDKGDARNAIKWYQQYLRLAPANYVWRKQAKSIIALLQSRI